MEKISQYLENEFHKKVYVTENGCNLINRVQEMSTRERIVIKDENSILIPGYQLHLVNDRTINAFTTRIDDEYFVLVNKGIIEEQRTYLDQLDWNSIYDIKQRKSYIDDIIEYGFYFIVFHEYAHIFCGHVDAGLSEFIYKRAQECEADMFSMDYLVKFIELSYKKEDSTLELEKLFLAVYFLFEKMQKEKNAEWYNDKLIQNYYDDDRITKRSHPLDAQRILYLYEMLNIVIVTDKIQMLPIKENIIEKLKILKRLTNVKLLKRDTDYINAAESVQKLKKTLQDIRVKIPRICNVIEIGD